MDSTQTSNFTIWSNSENFTFWKKSKNFFRVHKTSGSGQFTLVIVNYLTGWSATYYSDTNGYVYADLTALIETFDSSITLGFTITYNSTTETIDKEYSIKDGINPKIVAMLINKKDMPCDLVGVLPNINKITLPSKILRTEEFYTNMRVKLFWSDFDSSINDVFDDTYFLTDISWSQNVLMIPNCTSFYETEKINVGQPDEETITKQRWKLTYEDKNKRYCYLSFRSIIDNMPNLAFFLELRDFDINAEKTDMQVLGNGFDDFVNGLKITAKVGLSDLSAYDYAYYTTLITFSDEIKFTDLSTGNEYDCTIATNKINIKSGDFGRYDFEIELNLYSNVD